MPLKLHLILDILLIPILNQRFSELFINKDNNSIYI